MDVPAVEKHLAQLEGRYRALLEAAPDAMVVVNEDGEIVLLNLQAEKQFGYHRGELLGQQVKSIIPVGFAERLIADGTRTASEALAQQIGTGIELTGRRKDGGEFPIELMLSPVESADGILVTAAIRDISVRKAAERRLAQMEERYRGLLEAAPDAMVVVNEDGEIVLLNLQAEKQFGYRRDELLGQAVSNIIPEGFAERLIADGLRSAEDALAQQIGMGIELRGRRNDGSEFPIELMLSPLGSADGILVTAAIRNIAIRKKAEAHLLQKVEELNRSNEELEQFAYISRSMARQMAHAAQHDCLTGLPNRTLLLDRVNHAVALAPRHRKQVALLFLDLDGFKHINDSLGHSIGDGLLNSVAKRLAECVRCSDTVSRQGGDEFVVLLSEVEHAEDAAITARRMLEAVARPHIIDQHELHVTTSIGVAAFPDDGGDAETLIRHADMAMYQAKQNGNGSFRFFTPEMNKRAIERQAIEEGLRRALERNELMLHYQPKYCLRTGEISGAEALLRWMHPTRGVVPPDQFIPVAEECGLIVPIGAWVMREACRQAREWVDRGLRPVTMAVNVSAREFSEDDFVDGLFDVLGETRLDPARLEIELTESVLMKRADRAAAILKSVRDGGVKVAIDDFGTGYSSLSYLQKFPVDALKIDQSFVRQISTVGDDTAIVTAVIGMARSLELRVVAEGVETLAELAFLRRYKCDEAQGFYLSRPVGADQFARMLASSSSTPAGRRFSRRSDVLRHAMSAS
jgi:diguanylate cyclase (GGDEF)-like protein/PAS domain S-box-containing protein